MGNMLRKTISHTGSRMHHAKLGLGVTCDQAALYQIEK